MISGENKAFLDSAALSSRVMEFRRLPRVAKYAVMVYLVDHWELNFPESALQRLRERRTISSLPVDIVPVKYRSKRFGLARVSTKNLQDQIMLSDDIKEGFENFADYHQWYVSQGGVAAHKAMWPPIASCMAGELFEDGWHRFHSYVAAGKKIVPVLWFAE